MKDLRNTKEREYSIKNRERTSVFDYSEAGTDAGGIPWCCVTFGNLLALFESASLSIKEDNNTYYWNLRNNFP